jgi:hypothetical protein
MSYIYKNKAKRSTSERVDDIEEQLRHMKKSETTSAPSAPPNNTSSHVLLQSFQNVGDGVGEEFATGDIYFSHPVYIRTVEFDATDVWSLTTRANFFGSPTAHIVDFGGDTVQGTYSTALPKIDQSSYVQARPNSETNTSDLAVGMNGSASGLTRLWVKYTKE